MPTLTFSRNDYPTLGVEIELQLLDADSLALTSKAADILEAVPERLKEKFKLELMQCYLEINTDICRSVGEVRRDLCEKLEILDNIAEPLGLKLLWAGTHPFSSWRDQKITATDRYKRLVGLMQDVAMRLVTFGLHVHVGVDTGDKAVMVCDRMLRHLPLLLSLTANSPFWEGRNTGLCSNRSMIMDGLPTAGLPHRMRNWSEYVWLVNHLVETGFINTVREIWWDIRPHHKFGTVEVRVCDIPKSLDHVLALTALIQCLVRAISMEIDEGTYKTEDHPMMVQQNKWRAARFGSKAPLVNGDDFRQYNVGQWAEKLVRLMEPYAKSLGCQDELQDVATLPGQTGADQQNQILARAGSSLEVVREMLEFNDWRATAAARRERTTHAST